MSCFYAKQTMNKISLAIITADSWRHRFFVNTLSGNFDVAGVVAEAARNLPPGDTKEDNEIIAGHILERKLKEEAFFGQHTSYHVPAGRLLSIPHGHSGDTSVFKWVVELKPTFAVLFGSGIIKDPLLSHFQDRMINLHLGLSPYYRGSATSFWPLVFGEPECVGSTVHLAVPKADAGAILGQARPENIVAEDCCQEIGCKNIISGARLMIECIKSYQAGKVTPQVQELSRGRVFKLSDFNAQNVLKMRSNFDNGMMAEYIQNKDIRDSRYPIITLDS